ncbi:hypothetical protein [Petrachloros mirabilis]
MKQVNLESSARSARMKSITAFDRMHRGPVRASRGVVEFTPKHPLPTDPVTNHHRSQVNSVLPSRGSAVRVKITASIVCLTICLFILSSLDGLAQTGALDQSPAEIVKKYFALDQKGAKLDSLSYEALAPYRDWQEEPAWGRVVVIRGFTVAEHYRQWEIVDRLEVVIPVTFEVIGAVYMETAGFVPEPGVEEIRVRVKSVRNRWRIVEPVLPPHVGQKRMINFVREAWVKETEPDKRKSLALLQDELRKAR